MPSLRSASMSLHLAASLLILTSAGAAAGAFRDQSAGRPAARGREEGLDAPEAPGPFALPSGIAVRRDVEYGPAPRQRFDVYAPAHAQGAAVVFMVHGGGWAVGDKHAASVVANKAARWVPRGIVLISANYRMLPVADPIEQARDVARAVAAAQQQASSFGGDRAKFVLMGHSAGAHLVALLDASPALASHLDVTPWLGTVALDSAALDVPTVMQSRHLPLYDRAFGSSPEFWNTASPFRMLANGAAPVLAVCSTRRQLSCPEAHRFVARATSLGVRAAVLEEDLSHAEINERLGTEGAYTDAVEAFLKSLDPAFARAFAGAGSR